MSRSRKNCQKKETFHITIIGNETGLIIRPEHFAEIKNIVESFNWSFTPTQDFFLISKTYPNGEIRRSIIQTVTLPSLDGFYKELASRFGIIAETPFPHITLFTDSTEESNRLNGIGLYSEKQFQALSPTQIYP